MRALRATLFVLSVITGMGCPALVRAQSLPAEPRHDSGQGVTGAFEGWFKNQDGSFNLLFGYYNRNQREDLDIPIGPSNAIEPVGPDQGQPTHFLPAANGVFSPSLFLRILAPRNSPGR